MSKPIRATSRRRSRIGQGDLRRRTGAKLDLRMAGLLPQRGAACIAPAMPPSPALCDRPIVLVGMMGAGKSTVGRRLAERLGLPFVDSDEEVERGMGLGIAEIFERHGEARFREEERRIVAELAAGPPRVIAAGGGAFAEGETRRLILAYCTAVWIDASVETLAARLDGDRARPLLGSEPLAALAERRRPFYAGAPLRVEGDEPPEAVAEAIAAALKERAG